MSIEEETREFLRELLDAKPIDMARLAQRCDSWQARSPEHEEAFMGALWEQMFSALAEGPRGDDDTYKDLVRAAASALLGRPS